MGFTPRKAGPGTAGGCVSGSRLAPTHQPGLAPGAASPGRSKFSGLPWLECAEGSNYREESETHTFWVNPPQSHLGTPF